MKKPFIVANVREITDLLDKGEISYSRMVEMLNEIAEKFYDGKASPGEGAVIVEGVKDRSCDNCKHSEKEVTPFPCDRCVAFIYDCWEPKNKPQPLTLPDNSTGMLMDALRKSEIN